MFTVQEENESAYSRQLVNGYIVNVEEKKDRGTDKTRGLENILENRLNTKAKMQKSSGNDTFPSLISNHLFQVITGMKESSGLPSEGILPIPT